MVGENLTNIDAIFFGAHPDDVELSAGGAIANMTKEGKKVVIVDFTQGELGTRGSAKIRKMESEKAAEILGVKERINLSLPDGFLTANDKAIDKAIFVIRKYQPKIVVMPPEKERHPDHETANRIVRSAMFKAGLTKIITKDRGKHQEPYRTRKLLSYMQHYSFHTKPDIIIDISDTFYLKLEAIKAYSSQINVPGKSNPDEPQTLLSRPEFLEELEAKAIYFGSQIGCRFAEPFMSVEPVGLKSLSLIVGE